MDTGGVIFHTELHPPGCSSTLIIIALNHFHPMEEGQLIIGYSRVINGVRHWLATEQKVHTEPTRGKVCLRVDGTIFLMLILSIKWQQSEVNALQPVIFCVLIVCT